MLFIYQFKTLSRHIQNPPESNIIDFEAAAKNAYIKTYGNIRIRHCIFHMGQNLHRKIKKDGLTPIYDNSQEYRIYVRSLVALAFLPEQRVVDGFNLLRNEVINLQLPGALSIFDYFKK